MLKAGWLLTCRSSAMVTGDGRTPKSLVGRQQGYQIRHYRRAARLSIQSSTGAVADNTVKWSTTGSSCGPATVEVRY